MLILKHVVLEPPQLQRGPLLGGFSHLALKAGEAGLQHRLQRRSWSDATLRKASTMSKWAVCMGMWWVHGNARLYGVEHPPVTYWFEY